jgi:hypothetical protein
MQLSAKRFFLQALLLMGLAVPYSSADKLILLAEESVLRYQISKYGTVLVEGVLTDPVGSGLTGVAQIERNDALINMSGEVVLEHANFDSQHVRRDDEVKKLFLTPIHMRVATPLPCHLESGVCRVNADLTLNNQRQRYAIDLRFRKDRAHLLVDVEFAFQRDQFDLVFTEGFAGTLDMAIAQDVIIRAGLRFAIKGLSALDDVPNAQAVGEDEKLRQREPSWLERFESWMGR